MAEKAKTPTKSIWAKAAGIEISPDDVLINLKLEPGGEFLDELTWRKAAVAFATRRGVSVDEEDIEEALGEFYVDRDLFEPEQIEKWLASARLEEGSVRDFVTETVLIEQAGESLITDEAVEERFAASRHELALAEVEIFGFSTDGEAKEFMLAVREHEIGPEGGTLAEVMRRDAPEEIGAVLFSAEPGELIGPVEAEDGSYEVYVLNQIEEATLDEDMYENLRAEMFGELVEAELSRDPLEFLA